MAVDFLQFPVQTLSYGAGDCDDLSICYASTLEAIGVPAAFITVPGHIFTAFNTGVVESEKDSIFSQDDNLIIHGGEVWIPVETTLLNRGFIEAWKNGARQWRKYQPLGQAELIPIQSAWKVYEPIGFDLGERQRINIPAEEALIKNYRRQLDIYASEAIRPRIVSIEQQISSKGPSVILYNKLGILYTQFQLMDKARECFLEAVELKPNAGALMNIGHIDFLGERYIDALSYYRQAEQLAPKNAKVLLAVSRANHALENFDQAVQYYEKLKAAYPDFAERFSYLSYSSSEKTRATDLSDSKKMVVWGEE